MRSEESIEIDASVENQFHSKLALMVHNTLLKGFDRGVGAANL